MPWHAYRLIYRLESPLHVGWRKVGNLMQTRSYVTGRSWWGAATAHLTQWLGGRNYQPVGEFVRDNLIFGYFFLAEDPAYPLIPRWDRGELCYGSYSADEFERRFVKSLASTAIAYQHNTAAEGQLHEVEFIVPQVEGSGIFVVGHLLVKENTRIVCEDHDVKVDNLSLLTQVLAQARIGGERRYGFGRVRQIMAERIVQSDLVFGHRLNVSGEKPILEVSTGQSLSNHCLIDGLDAEGEIEPLLGREWNEDTGPGRRLSAAVVCWTPGSQAQQSSQVEIGPMGVGAIAS